MSWLSDQVKRPWTNESNPAAKHLLPEQLRKPGGDVKRFTDWTKNSVQWLSHHAFGADYPGKDRRTKPGATDDIEEPGTKATVAGIGRSDKGNAAANRRGVEQVIGFNQNKGKTHSLLTRKIGGRGNTA